MVRVKASLASGASRPARLRQREALANLYQEAEARGTKGQGRVGFGVGEMGLEFHAES